MRLAEARFRGYKRFTDTVIKDIPKTARLIVLAGPNGFGKSSIFDGFRTWHGAHGGLGYGWDSDYGLKIGSAPRGWPEHVSLTLHDGEPEDLEEKKKMVYLRTAFRHEGDFRINNFARLPSPLNSPRIQRMVDNDVAVSDNYQRLVMQSISDLYGDDLPGNTTKEEITDRLLGTVAEAMTRVLPDVTVSRLGMMGGVNDMRGTFQFSKGTSRDFPFMNLSGGEKAVFDLILDMVVKREFFDNTLWCIDEPESHINTRIQGKVLEILVEMLPPNSQLLLASHSIGFMHKAWEIAESDPSSVVFIDMENHDFDEPVTLVPMKPTRDFWKRTLDVALGDLAALVAPKHLVLCEGKPVVRIGDPNAEFDAVCYRRIFGEEHPDTDFLSVGSANDVRSESLKVGNAVQAIVQGTRITKLVDGDGSSERERNVQKTIGVGILRRRHLEEYLLDDEVITALCDRAEQPEKHEAALKIKADGIRELSEAGSDSTDFKLVGGRIYARLVRLLELQSAGSNWNAFARDTLAPLVVPGMSVYRELEEDVFGELDDNATEATS